MDIKISNVITTLQILIFIFVTPIFQSCLSSSSKPTQILQQNSTMSRDHVQIWFNDNLSRKHPRRQTFLNNMIELVAGTSGTIAIDNAPILDKLYPIDTYINNTRRSDRVLIPSIVARHNRNSSTEQQMKVMVSFDLSPSSDIHKNQRYLNSFVVAKHYADVANTIFPGTVDTLLLHHDDYLRVNSDTRKGHVSLPSQLHSAWNSLKNTSSSNSTDYKLGVTISLNLCKNSINDTAGNSSKIMSKFLEYADVVIPVVYVKPPVLPVNFTPYIEHEMQLEAFQNCEGILKSLKPEVEVIPLVICTGPQARKLDGESQFLQCWKLMSNWAIKSGRKVIMFEAFDSSDPEYVQEAGWWRVRQDATNFDNENWFEKKSNGSEITCTLVQSQNVNQTIAFKPTNDASQNKTFDVMIAINKTSDLSTDKARETTDEKPDQTTNINIVGPTTSTETSHETSMTLNKEEYINNSGTGGQHVSLLVAAVLTSIFLLGLAAWFYYKRKYNGRSEVSHQRFQNGDDDFQVLI